jgi:hypothetical protein
VYVRCVTIRLRLRARTPESPCADESPDQDDDFRSIQT